MERYCYDFPDERKRGERERFVASKKFVFIKLDNLAVYVLSVHALRFL